MSFNAKILCDSISLEGIRLTTLEVTFPRIILSEFNTHRMLSKNSSSSRAIPVEKQIKRIKENPFIPEYWGKNQKGMQASQELQESERDDAIKVWLQARDNAIKSAESLLKIGAHKQITNRLLEPFMWQTVIVSATEFSNFFALRRHKDAQPEIKKIADLMFDAIQKSKPKILGCNDWHLPLVSDEEIIEFKEKNIDVKLVSIGRCCRVSYLTHNGKRDPIADIELEKKLQSDGHNSPMEHVARPMTKEELSRNLFLGNFRGWIQYRKTILNEDDFSKMSRDI